jgi:hypothetical protein
VRDRIARLIISIAAINVASTSKKANGATYGVVQRFSKFCCDHLRERVDRLNSVRG